ncbi:transglutaminase domain-containing protein [Winogradskyella litoriviva]|uniref:Transglutaminase domain-containing protein n=1 Tax=Winogradskyella litoriviva TaxID=1220182 RepID=A0ABX2E4Y6_9FLAO|nr:transglutaminase-like domain-containing protein [Winogradskyella litoriviva]NRD23380.1 transglutaminase domain-containing protein [Winogradskyella litoriviva]
MKSYFVPIITLLLTFYNLNGVSQNLHLKSKFEKIKIKEDSTFTNEIIVTFKKSDEVRIYPIFYDSELEEISNIRLYVKKGKRQKQIAIKKIYEQDVKLDYITSQKNKSVVIPADMDIILSYQISCNQLMYFASLHFSSYNVIDTLKYQINIPKQFQLAHKTIYTDSLPFFKIDSTKTNTGSEWLIVACPKKIKPDPLQFFGIYKNMKIPFMRTIVYPNSYNNKPISYINDWYNKNVAEKKGLNVTVKEKIDDLTSHTNDPLEIVNIIYNYVKNSFKYVAIEIGMGAFIPSHPNEVYLNKQGDCKDLSNFLSEALRYKGITSNIALAATFDHISDCDFPSLSSANHVIATAFINNKTLLLDPTDPIHIEGTPVQSLQGRTILIVNSNGGLFYKVEALTPQQNKINYKINLKLDSKKTLIEGDFNIDYFGASGNYLRRNLNYETKIEFNNYSKQLYQEIFGNQSVSNLNFTNEVQKFHFNGHISINGKTFNDNQNKYLFIDFLPRLIETENRETLMEGTYLRNSFYKQVQVTILLDEPIEIFNSINYEYMENGISLKMEIKATSNLVLECNYDFISNYIFIDKENISKTNEILQSFKKIINEPIVLKKQKI